jgi:hypothetical protein
MLWVPEGWKKKSSSSGGSKLYEFPLGYIIEDIIPNGGMKKVPSTSYSNVSPFFLNPNTKHTKRKQEFPFVCSLHKDMFFWNPFSVFQLKFSG